MDVYLSATMLCFNQRSMVISENDGVIDAILTATNQFSYDLMLVIVSVDETATGLYCLLGCEYIQNVLMYFTQLVMIMKLDHTM